MRPHAPRIVVAVIVCFLALSICLPLASTSSSSAITQVPVIKLASLHGYTAEISDYHFDAQQHFCFTLTNTSSLPVHVIAGRSGGDNSTQIFSQTNSIFVAQFGPVEKTLNGIPMSFVLFSDGLSPQASTTICLTNSGNSSGSDEIAALIAHSMFVAFAPVVNMACEPPPDSVGDRVLVHVTRATNTEQCFIVSNTDPASATAVGLSYSGKKNSFDLLSVNPARQPFAQHLRFSRNPGSVDDLGNIPLSFALLSGGSFSNGSAKNGVGSGEISSEFCIGGNFEGLTPEEIIQRTYVRVDGKTRQCFNNCCPVGQGQTGVLAGEPR